MKINGRFIAEGIKEKLKVQIANLSRKDIIPNLSIILIGNDSSSQAYIRQKEKVSQELGIKLTKYQLPITKDEKELTILVKSLNNSPSVHGIVIQRPLPIPIDKEKLDLMIIPIKDVDGFSPQSHFLPPVALAVLKILKLVYKEKEKKDNHTQFLNWLKKNHILVVGRGETAGKPIVNTLNKMGIKFTIAHSQTMNIKELCLDSDIIISCVGKDNILRHDMITKKSIVIGVGLFTDSANKLQTDYNQEEISQKALFYTPVPGGVGPVNVVSLMENLVQAAILQNPNIFPR